MHRHWLAGLGALLTVAVGSVSGCTRSELPTGGVQDPEDVVFAALQARGKQVMGVDQYSSTHLFDALADGGRIGLQRDVDDPAAVARIRRHLREIAEAFASGDFSLPALVHRREVPGTAIVGARKDRIQYVYRDLPRGAELRLVTNDPEAIRAIHEFVAFQRKDHQAGGLDHGAAEHATRDHGRSGMGPAGKAGG
ncbi:MAG: hypothetical protein HY560_14210 [Gemmatimonadetes bacterium]|nr:hypothetical protein [Gemmatimonadota bacterium]